MRRRILTRPFIIGFAIVIQLCLLFVAVEFLSGVFAPAAFILQVVSIIALLFIINQDSSAQFKLPWAIIILTAPLLGGIIYFITASDAVSRKQRMAYAASAKKTSEYIIRDNVAAVPYDSSVSGVFSYLERRGFPVYQNTDARYFSLGDDAFISLKKDLEGAKRYILLEYFIIDMGTMWLEILRILKQKVAEGVEVRVMYDDVATMSKLSGNYARELKSYGIKCIPFNPFVPVCSTMMNYRDHRKIAVIDGCIAYTGGFNIADEYVNRIHPFGISWKDTGVRLEGDAAWQLALFFFTMWSFASGTEEDYSEYIPSLHAESGASSFIQPYAHTPLKGGQIVGNVYLNIINRADRYLYIYTPYLIPDQEIVSALCLAAGRGVDVRIILPGIPDKKLIWLMTKAYAGILMEHGVKIYRYSLGFLHAKCLVADDLIASVGTANLDNRSLYHSFEDGCLFYNSDVVEELKADFLFTLTGSPEMKLEKPRFEIFSSAGLAILRVFSPLL